MLKLIWSRGNAIVSLAASHCFICRLAAITYVAHCHNSYEARKIKPGMNSH